MTRIEKGSGAGSLLYLDCFSGLSGDMILSAMLDLGVPKDVVREAVGKLPLDGYEVRVEKEFRRSVEVARFFVDVEEEHQPHRHFAQIREMIESSGLDPAVARTAVDIFEVIAQAEARVHGSTVEDVHFHEVGAVDSIVDIVGAAAAIEHVGADICCGVVPLGKGSVKTRHGILPLPAPATLLILEGVPVEGTEVPSELTTPTGAAIVKACAKRFGPIPPMTPRAQGFGAGSRSTEARPGILRAVLGSPSGGGDRPETCYVIEANIDDVTGEVAADASVRLMELGALDAWIEPIQMKKGRPALKIGVLCRREDLDRMGLELMRHTPTIGLRYYGVGRMEMRRSIETVETEWGPVRVKVSRGPDGIANAAPEYEDCAVVARERGIPLKRVMATVTGMAQRLLDDE